MSVGIVPLDDGYLTSVFDDLTKLEVQLDSDPLVYGPKRLNQKVALVRKMATQCERMFLDAAQKHANYKRAQRAADLLLDMSMKHLLANDPEVRAGRAVSEREAVAAGKLKREVQEVAAAKQAIEDLEAVLAVIKAKRSDLRDIQGRLRDQMRLCQEEIGLGSRWGSKSPRGVELQPGQGFADGSDVEAIESVIQSVRQLDGAETHLEAEVDDSDPEEEVETSLMCGIHEVPLLEASGSEEQQPRESRVVLDVGIQDPLLGPFDSSLYDPQPSDSQPSEFSDPFGIKKVSSSPPPGVSRDMVVSGEDLVAEFGFVPHCSVCGEIQAKTYGGVVCSNGHGGATSVAPALALNVEEETEVSVATLFPETADDEEVSGFLARVPVSQPAPAKTRFQIEEEDGMDLDSLLEKWS